jgi:hypothetical protein
LSIVDSFANGLRLPRARSEAVRFGRQNGGLPGVIGAQAIERGGERGVRLRRLFQLMLADGELGGQSAALGPLKHGPAGDQHDAAGQTEPGDQAPLIDQRDHGASSISAALW